MSRLRVLTIGHSYVVRLNRSVAARIAQSQDIDLTVAAPSFFHGDLRSLALEPRRPDARFDLRAIGTHFSKYIHFFSYSWRELRRLVRDGSFDVVHAWEEPYIFAGYEIARAVAPTRARFCFRTAQSLVKAYPPPFAQFERAVLRRAQGWIAGGHQVRQAMLAKGFPSERSRVITLGVDAAAFSRPPEAVVEQTRRELGLAGPIIGFVGRFVRAKGVLVLLDALEQVRGRWSLLLLGSGPLESTIRSWVSARGLNHRVRIVLAKHDEVPRYLAAMDMLVAPSQTTSQWVEQFGRMIIEAFACRVPVIGSNSGEIPHVVGDAGRLVAEGKAEAWASAIEELRDSPRLREELAARGHARCMEHYTDEEVANRYVDFYRELADAPL